MKKAYQTLDICTQTTLHKLFSECIKQGVAKNHNLWSEKRLKLEIKLMAKHTYPSNTKVDAFIPNSLDPQCMLLSTV